MRAVKKRFTHWKFILKNFPVLQGLPCHVSDIFLCITFFILGICFWKKYRRIYLSIPLKIIVDSNTYVKYSKDNKIRYSVTNKKYPLLGDLWRVISDLVVKFKKSANLWSTRALKQLNIVENIIFSLGETIDYIITWRVHEQCKIIYSLRIKLFFNYHLHIVLDWQKTSVIHESHCLGNQLFLLMRKVCRTTHRLGVSLNPLIDKNTT